ncbi:MAG: YcaO-like family protein [Deltaproteobacteria bacterium]
MAYKIVLKDAFKSYTYDQDKILSPEETVARFRARLKEVDLDVLKETLRIDNGRLGIPVYFSICGRDAETAIGAKKQMGKGGTPQQAEASAVMELAERFSFFSFLQNPQNFIVQEYRHLKEPALPFERIAQSVHDDSDELEVAGEIFSKLPLRWTRAYSLADDQTFLIPFDWFYAINEFNGSSAGNGVEEALLQGVCEVVERHVSSIISRNQMPTPALDIEPSTDPLARELIQKYRSAGVELFITDFTLDMGIPSVGVLAYDPSTFPDTSEMVWTAGTTTSPHKSLIRALTEVAQLAGDFNTGSNYVASGLPKFKSLEEAAYVIDSGPQISISSLPDISNPNMKVELENVVSALARLHMPVIAVDITHPKLGVPAFYTLVPGAHFRERAAGTSVGMLSAKLLAESGDPLRAMAELRDMDRLMPGKYYVKFYLGSCRMAMNEPQKALKHFEEALDLDPKPEDIPTIYSYMGHCLKDLEKYKEALSALEKGERWDAERTDIYNLMGFCYYKLKEHPKAIGCFKKVIALNPSSAIDYANIASNYRDMGDKENAMTYYRLALELDPTIDFARENLLRLEQKAPPKDDTGEGPS